MVTYALSLPAVTDRLSRESRLLVDRSRLWPPSTWRQRADETGSVADSMHQLAGTLTTIGQILETGTEPSPDPSRRPPRPAYDGALSDQVAVTAHDVVVALRAVRPGDARAARPVEALAADALAEVLRVSSAAR